MRTAAWLATWIVAAGLLCGCGAEAPSWSLADLPSATAADDGWGPAAREDGRAYRAALAGKDARLVAPVWWGRSPRPPEGAVYTFRVTYKDTAAKPVVFSSHAGVASYWGASEVHRFGGLGDGQWKTADVPISWDLVMRKNVPGRVTEFFIRADKDLPVASVVPVPTPADAAERYCRESREWVARVQAEKRRGADIGRPQKPVLPAAWADKPLVPFARTYLATLLPSAAPQAGEAGAALKLRMARNEYETAGFAVYANGRDLKSVNFIVTDLAGPDGKLACEIDCRTAEYAAVGKNLKAAKKSYRLFPQRFWPAYPVNVPAGRSHAFWVTVKTLGQATRPGRYTGQVKIVADNAAAIVPIEVEVVPVMLLTMQQAKLDLGSCLGGLCTLQELKTLAEFNHTGMHIWFGGAQTQMKVRNGKLTQDWYYLDEWMAYGVKRLGWTHMFWFLGGDPLGFPDTLNLERDLYRAQPGDRQALRRVFLDKTNAAPHRVIPEVRDLYRQWVRQTAEHAKRGAWPKTVILHPYDEPNKWTAKRAWDNPFHKVIGAGPWIRSHFIDSCSLIRQGAAGYDDILIGADVYSPDAGLVFLGDIDVFCTNAIRHDPKLGDKVRAGGKRFWQYGGCNDQASASAVRLRFGFFFGAYDSRGSLVWAYNTLPRLDTSDGGGWGFGWYTPFGTVQTPFMIGLREAWDDRRWSEHYKQAVVAADPDAGKLLDGIGRGAVDLRNKDAAGSAKGFASEIDRYEQMDRWRGQLIDAIIRAGK